MRSRKWSQLPLYHQFIVAVGVVTASLISGCGTPNVTILSVTPGRTSISLGGTATFKVTANFSDGTTKDVTAAASWSSSNPSIATVSSSGVASSVAVGTAMITASAEGGSGTASLTVSNAALTAISVTSPGATIALGQSAQLKAEGTYTDKSVGDITDQVSWSAANPSIATISTTGLAVSKALGSTVVTASLNNVSGTGQVTVSAAVLASLAVKSKDASVPLGDSEQFSAIGIYTDGSTLDMTSKATWLSSAPEIVTINAAGMGTAKAVGATSISAAVGGINGMTTFTVSAAALSSITLAPARPTVPLGSSQQLTTIATFSDGSTEDVTQQVSWNVDSPAIASITPLGMASGLQVGTTAVEASLNGVQASGTITVQPLLAVAYFDATSGVDSTIRVTNPGTTGQNLCAMVYIFDQDQQMSECCGCIISQDGLLTLSLKNNLLNNPLTGTPSTSGTVMLVSAQQNSSGCDASSMTPAGVVVAWATHLPQSKSGTMSSAEEPFSSSPLPSTLASSLQAQCSFIQQLGSGQGFCGCGPGE